MGYIGMGIPEELVLKLTRSTLYRTFVETGTFMGSTTFWAAKHFSKVITIEINSETSRKTASYPHCPPNIEFIIGDSGQILPQIVATLEGPSVFWLDGHYCGLGTGGETNECPIINELAAAAAAVDPIIMIDDARCFLGPPPPPHKPEHWVSIDILFQFFAHHFPNHATTIHDDVIISVPKQLKPILDTDWLERFNDRFDPPPPPRRSVFQRAFSKLRRGGLKLTS